MGLAEQLRAGANLSRKSISFSTSPSGSGSVSIDASYCILGIQVSNPCRIRFYDNVSSRDNAGEIIRSFPDTNVSASVALVGDFSMSAAGLYSVDPIVFGISDNFSSSYYRVESNSSVINVTLNTYTIEDGTVLAGVNPIYSVANRRRLPLVSASLEPSKMKSGSISNSEIPQTYLLWYASGSDAENIARLRLYSTSGSLTNATEQSRSFSTEPSASANLIVDMILSGSGVTYFSPKIVGSNLQNMGQNLSLIRGNQTLLSGKNEMYYILQNASGSGIATSISASVFVYALEG